VSAALSMRTLERGRVFNYEHISMQSETAAVSPLRPEEADQRQHVLLHLHSRVSQILTSVCLLP